MTQEILQGVNRRVEHLRSLIQPLGRDSESSTVLFLDVKEGLRHGRLLRDYLVQALKLQWKGVFENQVEDYNLSGKLLLIALDTALQTCQAIQTRVKQVLVREVPDEEKEEFDRLAREFEESAAEISKLMQEFTVQWPWVDSQALADSVSAESQGTRRHSAREVFDELRRRRPLGV